MDLIFDATPGDAEPEAPAVQVAAAPRTVLALGLRAAFPCGAVADRTSSSATDPGIALQPWFEKSAVMDVCY
jgi:hypothetical protein